MFGPFMLLMMGGAVFTIVMAILPIINLNQLMAWRRCYRIVIETNQVKRLKTSRIYTD